MAIGKEIKVVLSLDDNGFSVNVRKAGDNVKGLGGQLKGLTGATEKVEAGMAGVSRSMSSFADGFAAANRSISSTVDGLQKNVLGGLNKVSKGMRDAATQAKAAATQQVDARLQVLQNEVSTNKKLLDSRAKSYADLRKLESTMRAQAMAAELAAEKARRSKKAGAGSIVADNQKEANRINANADAVRREANALETWIERQNRVQSARASSIAALENERKAVLANVDAKMKMNAVAAAVGKSNDKTVADLKARAAEREAAATKDAARAAAEFARQKKAYTEQEVRDARAAEAEKTRAARAAEAERLRAAREAAAERRRIARQELEEQRAQAKMVADMWRGMAQMYAGAKIERGIGNSVVSADDDQRARIMVEGLNLPKAEQDRLFADSQKISDQLKFISTKDVIKSKMSAISSLGYNHESVIDETLSTFIKAANNMEMLGVGHGDTQSTLRNVYGVTEMRQQTANPQAMIKTADLLNKAFIGTAGKVTLADVENALRRIGTGANTLSDEGLVNVIGLIDQFKVSGGDGGSGGGVSTVGTIIKMVQAYATGKNKSNKAVQQFVGAGILDDEGLDLTKDDAHVLKDAKNGNFKNVEKWIKDPIGAIQDMVPQIVAYTRKHKKEFYQNGADDSVTANQMLAVQQYLQRLGITQSAVQAVTAVGTPAARERLEHQSVTINKSDTVDQTAERLSKSYAGNMQRFTEQMTNFKVVIGDTLLPALTKLLEFGSRVVIMFRDFGQNNPAAASLSVIGAAVGGVVLSLKGFMSMFGSVGLMGVLRSLMGIAPAAAGSVSVFATALGFAGKALKTIGLAIIAYDVGTILGNWIDSFDAFGLMTTTIGDKLDNNVARMIYAWKQLQVGGERAIAWARNLVGMDSDEQYAKKTAELDARSTTNGRRLDSTLITAESKARQPVKLTKEKHKESKVAEPNEPLNEALEGRVKNASKAGSKRPDRDPLNKTLSEELGRMNSAKIKLDALVSGGETLESLRKQAEALVRGKLEADDLSVNHDKKNRPDWNDAKVQKLVDATEATMLYNEQLKAVEYANERVAATAVEADVAMNEFEAGGVAKQTDGFKSLTKEMARTEERLGVGATKFTAWAAARDNALFNQARTDSTSFAAKYLKQNEGDKADLLPTERARNEARLAAAAKVEDDEYNMRVKNLARQYAARRDSALAQSVENGDTLRETNEKMLAIDELYQREKAKIEDTYGERRKIRAEQEARELESATAKMAREWQDVGKAVDDIGGKAGEGFVNMLTSTLGTGRLAVGDFVKGTLQDIANVKLKQALADPLNGAITQGTDWLKTNVFGMQKQTADTTAASAATARATADTTATTATNTMAGTIMSQVIPALQLMAAKLTGGSGGGLGSIGSLFGFGGGATGSAGATLTAGDFAAQATPSLPFLSAFADGGIMTSMGPLQLRKYANGGIANSPQLAMYGEAGPEAYVPLPDGRSIPVTMRGGAQQGANVQVNVINQTSTPVNAQQGAARFDGKQMILDVVLSAASQPGSFRSGMKDAMKGG